MRLKKNPAKWENGDLISALQWEEIRWTGRVCVLRECVRACVCVCCWVFFFFLAEPSEEAEQMIGSGGAEDEWRESRGQFCGAGGEQPNVSLLFVCA